MYYERQTNAHAPVVLNIQPGIKDGEAIVAILGAAVFGFAVGMLIVAAWFGVL